MNRIFSLITASVLLILFVFIFFFKNETIAIFTDKQTIVVKDGVGKGVEAVVPAHPKRVAFLSSSSLELWLGTGGKDKVAICSKSDSAPSGLYEKLATNTVVLDKSNALSMEKILEQRPDLIVGAGSQAKLKEVFNKLGVAYLMIDNDSLEDTYYELELYGQMNNRSDLAQKEIERIKNNVQVIQKSYQGKKKPKVAFIWGTISSFSLITPNSRQGRLLNLAGGENILQENAYSSRYMPVSLEYIAKEDPDYIIFVTMGKKGQMQIALEKALNSTASWQLLRAVKEKKVYVLPPELFTSYYGLSIDEAIRYLNKILYPQS